MRPLAKSSLKSASHVGCRLVLWLLVVVPFQVVAAQVSDGESRFVVVPRVVFQVAVALLTVRYLGQQCKAGNIIYVCFETGVAVITCYVFLTIMWANVEVIAYQILRVYSYFLEKVRGEGLSIVSMVVIHLLSTTTLATGFLIWVLYSALDIDDPGCTVRFSSMVEVRLITPATHHLEGRTTETIKAPRGPGRNPVIQNTYNSCSPRTASDELPGLPVVTPSKVFGISSISTVQLLSSVIDYLNDQTI